MTNTKFRKRALLSSVAMLLVALVALGSATFAWFAANPNADATGISLKTTAATGLVLKTDTDTTFKHNATLNNGGTTFNLDPVSQVQSSPATFWKVEALAAGNSAARNTTVDPNYDPTIQSGTVGGGAEHTLGNVYKEDIFFKLSDGTAAGTTETVYLKGVTMTKNADADMEGCIRVAIVKSDGSLVGVYALSNASNENGTFPATGITANTTKYSEITLDAWGSGVFDKSLTSGSTKAISGKAVSSAGTTENAANKVSVYVWLDGEDTNCYSDNVGSENAAEILSSIKVDFSIVDA